MEPLKIKIDSPIVCRPRGEETLFRITKEILCRNTNNPTAYRKTDGSDAKSLKVTNAGALCNFLSISYDANEKAARVKINWTNFKLNQSSKTLIIQITGNHNVNIDVTVKILYPSKEPSITLESKTCSAVWGKENVGNVVIKGREDVGHDIWRYMYQTKVFIAQVEGFYIEGHPETQYAGVMGYMVSLNPWERKVIPLRYRYGNTFISQEVEKKLPLIYIYYTINNSGDEVIRKQIQDVFVMKFSPLTPTISLKPTRLLSEYILGTRESNLFEIELCKNDIHAQDLRNVSLTCADTRVVISDEGNFKYLVSLKTSSFQNLPSENINISLKASASNAIDEICSITLTTSQLNSDSSILLKKRDLIEIKDISEIQKNSTFVLYEGMDYRDINLVITNVSSRVLGGNNVRELKNIKIDIVSDFGVKFCNGSSTKKLQRLQDSSFESLDIRIQPSNSCSIKEFCIIVSSDFSNNLVIPVKVETKEKLNPQISIEFEQDFPLTYADNEKFKPIFYDNQRIGLLTLESVCNDDPAKYAPYNLLNNPIKTEDERLSIKPIHYEEILMPQSKMLFEVFLSGYLDTDDYFIVSSGGFEKKVSFLLQEQFYCLPEKVDFLPINNDIQFEYADVDKLLVGKLELLFPDEEKLAEVDMCIHTSEPFCFSDDSDIINIEKDNKYIDVYIKFNQIFGSVQNIKQTYQSSLVLSLTSSILKESAEANYGEIKITPIVAEAKPFAAIAFDNQPLDDQPALVYYTEEWYGDERNDVCSLLLGNTTSLPYYPNSDEQNDYVEFNNIRLIVLNGSQVLALDSPDTVIIRNGESSQSFAVYLNCHTWDKKTKEFEIEIRANVRTGNLQMDDVVICTDCFILKEKRNDGIYSLDLGTTGIVMAKQENFDVSTIKLQDAGDSSMWHIEKEDDIISSLAIIYKDNINGEECHQLLLSPTRTDYKNEARFIFVPAKFVVGQKRIPYVNRILNDIPLVAFDTEITNKADEINDDFIYSLDANRDEPLLDPDKYLLLIYENIFNRLGDENDNIKKLILTYPNTYTQAVLNQLRTIVENKFDDVSGFIDMIPESDAVVAYYFNSRINCFSDDKEIQSLREIKVGTERVLIYDMGAGTLDLSLVTITRNAGENKISANIDKKIGIPIAGNYLDWVLYEKFFKYRQKSIQTNGLSLQDSSDQEYQILKNLKDYIKSSKERYKRKGLNISLPRKDAETCLSDEFVSCLTDESPISDYIKEIGATFLSAISTQKNIKSVLETSDDISNEVNNQNIETNSKEKTPIMFSNLDEFIEDYLTLCSKTILDTFLGENKKIDRIVYSGRGSLFGPLRESVESYLKEHNKKLLVDNTIEKSDLKTCVARGAIHYFDLFSAEAKHSLTNRNQHLNLGVVYVAPTEDGGRNEVHYKEIIHPDDGKWSEHAVLHDGTWWREFENSVMVDLSVNNKRVYFIQTLLSEDKIKSLYNKVYSNPILIRDDMDWVFVNELFAFNTKSIVQQHKESIEIRVKIDIENNIVYSVGGRHPKGEKLIERIEDNIFYQRSMWPYISFKS